MIVYNLLICRRRQLNLYVPPSLKATEGRSSIMAKTSTAFVCQQCGYSSPKWAGQCASCGNWNTLVETQVSGSAKGTRSFGSKVQRTKGRTEPVILSSVKPKDGALRISTGIGELDRVLGGGIVSGMVTLIAGEPGIGKSTLLLQIADRLRTTDYSKKNHAVDGRQSTVVSDRRSVIYIAGEESATQIANRAQRLGIKGENTQILEETDVDEVLGQIRLIGPISLIIVDSIQTLTTQDLVGTAGSIGQVRECASRLTQWAKQSGTPLFLVGHVTKEGAIAGPRVLEHMVDTVLWFEGERSESLRILRTIKNRFGPTDEVGIFSMEEKGLREISNPSEMFLEEHGAVSGVATTALLEGSRPILVEVQALVVSTKLPFPKRVAQGVDSRRLELLIAILTRRAGIPLWDWDVYINIAGGIKVSEPGADLAICLAIASAFRDKPVRKGVVAIGEVGLLGEIRNVQGIERRLKEAKRLGYSSCATNKEVTSISEAINKFVLNTVLSRNLQQ